MHIGLVCSGYNSNVYFHTLLKSLYFYRANPIHFHIVANKVSWRVLKVLFNTWQVPEVNITFYDADEFIKDVRWVPNTHYSGTHGLLKLLFPKIIPLNVTRRILILDTDLTIVGDIYNLWGLFHKFNKRQAIGLVENQSEYYLGKLTETAPWPAINKGFNSGVMLYDLLKLKSMKWNKLWPNVTKRTAATYGATGLGDQDIINAVIRENPHIVHKVPCYWNTQMGDNSHSSDCYKANKVKIIHWNSPRKYNVQHQNGKYFKSLAISFLEYNGNLLRNAPLFCTQTSPMPTETSNDKCLEFRHKVPYRTLLFFREYKYEMQENDVTLLSQLSFDRIQNVEEIAKLWKGPIAFTFYLTDAELVKVLQFISESDILQGRQDIAYHAAFKDEEMYPVNYLRNTALRNVKTPYVFLTDIDFRPTPDTYEKLKGYLSQNMEKKALIIPAFEIKKGNLPKVQMPTDKVNMLNALENGSIIPFLSETWPTGHGPTNYELWKKSMLPYEVSWQPDFEPYIVVKSNVVEYSEEFLGFGWNKVSHIMELQAQNYEFLVLPDVFIIHKPHLSSLDNMKFRKIVKYRLCLKLLKSKFIKRLNKKYNKHFEAPIESSVAESDASRSKRELIAEVNEATTTFYDSTDFYMVWGGKEKFFGKRFKKQPFKNPSISNGILQMEKEKLLSDLRNHRLDSSEDSSHETDGTYIPEDSKNDTALKSVIDKVAVLEDRAGTSRKSENLTIVNVNANEDVLKSIADNIDLAMNVDLSGTEPPINETLDDFEDYEAYDYDALEKHYREKFTAKPTNNENENAYSGEDSEYTSEEKKIHRPATPIRYAPEVEKLYQESLRKKGNTALNSNSKSMKNETVLKQSTESNKLTSARVFEDIYEEFRVKFKDFDKIPRQN